MHRNLPLCKTTADKKHTLDRITGTKSLGIHTKEDLIVVTGKSLPGQYDPVTVRSHPALDPAAIGRAQAQHGLLPVALGNRKPEFRRFSLQGRQFKYKSGS